MSTPDAELCRRLRLTDHDEAAARIKELSRALREKDVELRTMWHELHAWFTHDYSMEQDESEMPEGAVRTLRILLRWRPEVESHDTLAEKCLAEVGEMAIVNAAAVEAISNGLTATWYTEEAVRRALSAEGQ